MKKRVLGFMALLLLVGISTKYVGSTFAKYTATLETKSGTATVATWAFKAENDTNALETFTVALDTTIDTTSLISGKIAPGTNGSFNVQLKNETSDVGVKFEMSLSNVANAPQNLVFKLNNVAFDWEHDTLVGYIARGETLTVPLTWVWPYGDGTFTSSADDDEDTADGIAHNTMTVNVNVRAIQTDPTAAVTTSTASTMTIVEG